MQNFIVLFTTGLLYTFGPCMFLCTPLVFSYFISTKRDSKTALKSAVVFSAIRSLVHVVLSCIIFIFGSVVIQTLQKYNWLIFVICGGFICLLGVLIIAGKHFSFPPHLTINTTDPNIFLLGILTGLSPCIPHIAVWGYIALTARNIFDALLYSFGFGLGEFIPPVIFGTLSGKISSLLKGKIFVVISRICGLLLIFLGLQLIFH